MTNELKPYLSEVAFVIEGRIDDILEAHRKVTRSGPVFHHTPLGKAFLQHTAAIGYSRLTFHAPSILWEIHGERRDRLDFQGYDASGSKEARVISRFIDRVETHPEFANLVTAFTFLRIGHNLDDVTYFTRPYNQTPLINFHRTLEFAD